MEKDKTCYYLLAIVCIVAIVGVVVLVLNSGTTSLLMSDNYLSGHAISASKTRLITDSGLISSITSSYSNRQMMVTCFDEEGVLVGARRVIYFDDKSTPGTGTLIIGMEIYSDYCKDSDTLVRFSCDTSLDPADPVDPMTYGNVYAQMGISSTEVACNHGCMESYNVDNNDLTGMHSAECANS